MRTAKVFSIFILSSIMLAIFIAGCNKLSEPEDALRGQLIPTEIFFEGKFYENTAEIAAVQELPDEEFPNDLKYIGKAFLDNAVATTEANTDYYEIYSIAQIDKNQAVAVKILLAGKTTSAYYYIKYERK